MPEPTGRELSEAERIRIRTVVETIWAMQQASNEAHGLSLGDYFSHIMVNADDGAHGRRLAKRLGIPFVLLSLLDSGAASLTPPEIEEWMAWPGREAVPEYTGAGWVED